MEDEKDIATNSNIQPVEKSKAQRIVEGTLKLLGLDEFVSYIQVLKNAFVIIVIVIIAIVEIFNTHLAERMTRNINKKKQHIKELRWEYMSANAEKNEKTKQSEIQKIVSPESVKALQEPPKKVELDN
jgi:cell division protein FtsL